jgi:hypothetical protein
MKLLITIILVIPVFCLAQTKYNYLDSIQKYEDIWIYYDLKRDTPKADYYYGKFQAFTRRLNKVNDSLRADSQKAYIYKKYHIKLK